MDPRIEAISGNRCRAQNNTMISNLAPKYATYRNVREKNHIFVDYYRYSLIYQTHDYNFSRRFILNSTYFIEINVSQLRNH